jgi:hypothetical protein
VAHYRLVSRLLDVAEISAGPSRVPSDVPQSSRFGRPRRPFKKGSARSPGRKQLILIIVWRGFSASSGTPLGAHVRSKASYTRRAVHRALRILTSWPGTARGRVCDKHQRGAAEASQLDEEEQGTQCVVAVWAQLSICRDRALVVCAEPSWTVIRVVAEMSSEQFARRLRGKCVTGVRDTHLKAERDARNPGRESEPGSERA